MTSVASFTVAMVVSVWYNCGGQEPKAFVACGKDVPVSTNHNILGAYGAKHGRVINRSDRQTTAVKLNTQTDK